MGIETRPTGGSTPGPDREEPFPGRHKPPILLLYLTVEVPSILVQRTDSSSLEGTPQGAGLWKRLDDPVVQRSEGMPPRRAHHLPEGMEILLDNPSRCN